MLRSGSSAKIFKDQTIVALYHKAESDPSWHVPSKSTRFNNTHGVTSKISYMKFSSPKFENSGGSTETEKFSEIFPKIDILDEDVLETGTANAVIWH